MSEKFGGFIVVASTVIVYILTVSPLFRIAVNSFYLLYIIAAFAGFCFFMLLGNNIKNNILHTSIFFVICICILFWVGVTGWFLSPFFYLLFVLAFTFAFIFSPFVSFLFISVLVMIFLPNIGSIDMVNDLITLASLIFVIPLSYVLQREYLHLKQTEKRVLILEEENKIYKNKVDEVLANKIVRLTVDLRQPANDIKQMALVSKETKNKDEIIQYLGNIAKLADTTLTMLEEFEKKTTGKKILHTRSQKKPKKK